MLNGAEMVEAANAAGESSPGSYGRAYGDFTSDAFRRVINSWFGGGNILARGSGTLTLTHRGIDGIDHATDDDDATTSNFEGKAGEATVRVKVSDFTGRLIPPGDGSRTIGQDFAVTAKLYKADPIPNLQMLVGEDVDDTHSVFTAPADTGNAVEYTATADATDGTTTPASMVVRVSPGQTEILDINLFETDPALHKQANNFSLSNGGSPFRISKKGVDSAQIVLASGQELTTAGTHDFKLVVNEYGRAPLNSSEIDVSVTIVVDNIPPTFVFGQPTSASVAERSVDEEIATFTGTDANNQIITFKISAKKVVADDDAKADELTHVAEQNLRAAAILAGFVIEGDEGFNKTGLLKTKTGKAKITAAQKKQPDFWETPEDDPDTDEDESDPKYPPVNSYVYVISLDDGTLTSRTADNIEFTLTVTDVSEPRAGSGQRLNIDEDHPEGEDNALEPAVDIPGTGAYEVDQQIDNLGNIVGAEEDEDDILFDVTREGGIYLRKTGSLDFESGIVTYTLSVNRLTGPSKLIVVSVNDVNEAPKFLHC